MCTTVQVGCAFQEPGTCRLPATIFGQACACPPGDWSSLFFCHRVGLSTGENFFKLGSSIVVAWECCAGFQASGKAWGSAAR